MEDGVHEECGITGVYFKNPDLSPRLLPGYKYSMLRMVQHRGQLSAGAAVFDDIKNGEYLKLVTEVGRVKDLFKENREQEHQRKEVQRYLQGRAGIGHVRYATSGRRKLSYFDLKRQAQPFLRDHPRPEKSFAESFNGNLANYSKLRADIVNEGYRLKTKVDTEVIVYLLSHSINALSGKDKKGNFVPANIFRVFEQVTSVLDGAYNLLTLFGDGNLAIVRDPRGFKPLVYGENKDLFAVASESIALEKIGIRKFRPVEPGACMVFNPERGLEQKIITKAPRRAYCHFERTYFCRANSIVDGKSINSSREGMGDNLAESDPNKRQFSAHREEVLVIPVPSTAIPATESFARKRRLDLSHAILVFDADRGFINDEEERYSIMDKKYDVIPERVKGKRIVVIDDSIVRGDTSKRIVKMLRKAGAKEVHLLSTEPPIRYPCFYGIDFPSCGELIANQVKNPKNMRDFERKVAKKLGADSVHYQTIEGLVDAMGFPKNELCLACVNGDYPTEWGQRNADRAEQAHRKK